MPHPKSASQSSNFIIDAEIVAVDLETGELKSFQDLSQRGRKDVLIQNIEIAVALFGYDLMYLNGQVDCLELPYFFPLTQLNRIVIN